MVKRLIPESIGEMRLIIPGLNTQAHTFLSLSSL
jgi:hypothetical protein